MTDEEMQEYIEVFKKMLEEEDIAGFELYKTYIEDGTYRKITILKVDLE